MSQIWNHVTLTEETAIPNVGAGVTRLHWTDRSPGTITRVSPSGKTFWFTEDRVEREKNENGVVSYRFAHEPNGYEYRARMTKKGWRANGNKVLVGVRAYYYDINF